ncbi:MAG: hypothetical protein JW919_07215 [Candidatus Omnitrophica bacterium]|nr:hypothetical protein [Candidatus Omnitrophota bacterium]
MNDEAPVGIVVFAAAAFLCGLVNIGIYVTDALFVGFIWQVEIIRQFVTGYPYEIHWVWPSFSPALFGVLLIYTGRCLLRAAHIGFMRLLAVIYLVFNGAYCYIEPGEPFFGWFNMAYFAALLAFLFLPRIRRLFKTASSTAKSPNGTSSLTRSEL